MTFYSFFFPRVNLILDLDKKAFKSILQGTDYELDIRMRRM